MIQILGELQDLRAVPLLVEIAEGAPDAMMSPETVGDPGPRGRAVYAREALVHILHPESRAWPGAQSGAPPAASEAFAERVEYHRRLKEWYDARRGATTRPAVSE
jgi:hypothetical protein